MCFSIETLGTPASKRRERQRATEPDKVHHLRSSVLQRASVQKPQHVS